jgi:tripartite-type tricarboxylate transporter receptor subunit TctC
LNYDIWNMMVAPAGTPPEIVDRLNRAARVALRDPEVLAAWPKAMLIK